MFLNEFFKINRPFRPNVLYISTSINTAIREVSWVSTALTYYKSFSGLNFYKFYAYCKYNSFYKVITSLGNTVNFAVPLLITFSFDALFDGDEPIWEPLEWSLIQTWLIFIFLFSWIGENLISSRFGSFTGRDKRVWFSWYKSMWWIELFYIITLGIAILLIVTPFYFELTYASSYIVNFWNWFSKVFFFKTLFIFFMLSVLTFLIQLQVRYMYFKKNLILVSLVLLTLIVLFFIQFYMMFYCYFTDNLWYVKNRSVDLIQLSHEPWKWSWDLENRDHFQYHNSRTVFWFKTDGPFAESFFLVNLLYLSSLFIVIIFWVSLFRRIIYLKEISYNFTIGVVSSFKQFFFFFFLFYLLIISCIVIIFLKFPFEFVWVLNTNPLSSHVVISVIH